MKVKGLQEKEAAKPEHKEAAPDMLNTAVSYIQNEDQTYQVVIVSFDGKSGKLGEMIKVGPATPFREDIILQLKRELMNAGLV